MSKKAKQYSAAEKSKIVIYPSEMKLPDFEKR